MGGCPIAPPPPLGLGYLWVCGFARNLWWVGPSNHPPPLPEVEKNPDPGGMGKGWKRKGMCGPRGHVSRSSDGGGGGITGRWGGGVLWAADAARRSVWARCCLFFLASGASRRAGQPARPPKSPSAHVIAAARHTHTSATRPSPQPGLSSSRPSGTGQDRYPAAIRVKAPARHPL